jgi:uncharacterized protein
MKLSRLLELGRVVRVIGFDDAPFQRKPGVKVSVAGVVCANTALEGMLWTSVRRDGWTATETLATVFNKSKYKGQVSVVLTDGIALGGFNVIDLPQLAQKTGLPCVAVMRRMPDIDAVRRAISLLPQANKRLALLAHAGEIFQREGHVFQVAGEAPEVVAQLLTRLCSQGKVPEPLRLAHHIGTAVVTGESGRRA